MKQLTRLQEIELCQLTKSITPDGDTQEVSTKVGEYKVVVQELTDNVSATIYGANINKMLRMSSVNKILEILLKSKLNNTSDNISKYRITYLDNVFKIVDVKSKYFDIERL